MLTEVATETKQETEITPPELEKDEKKEEAKDLEDEKLISPDDEITPPEETKKETTPDEYKDFTLPEGMQFNEDTMKAFKEIAKSSNLSQDKAQEFVSMGAKLVQDTLTQQAEYVKNLQKEWTKELVADKDFGGDKFNETFQRASRTLRKFDAKGDLLDLLTKGGILKSAPVIRFLATIDKSISEDTIIEGNRPKPEVKPEKILFPNFK